MLIPLGAMMSSKMVSVCGFCFANVPHAHLDLDLCIPNGNVSSFSSFSSDCFPVAFLSQMQMGLTEAGGVESGV